MNNSLKILAVALLLTSVSAGAVMAQTADDAAAQPQVNAYESVQQAPLDTAPQAVEDLSTGIPAGASGASVKFTNDGANRPVLETLTPDAQGIEIDPAAADIVSGYSESLATVEDMHAEEASSGLPQFDVTTFPKQIFWLTLLFAFLYFVNSRKVLPALSATIEGRAARIAGDIESAQNLRNEVERVRTEYEAAIAQAQAQGQKTLQDLQTQIKTDIGAQSAAFKTRSEAAVDALESRLNDTRGRIMSDLSATAAELTVDIAKAVAGITADDSAAKKAIASLNDKAQAA